MTALKQKAIHLVAEMPKEQMPRIIQYIHALKDKALGAEEVFEGDDAVTPKMRAFLELKKMLVPISHDLDYDKELTEVREKNMVILIDANVASDFNHETVML